MDMNRHVSGLEFVLWFFVEVGVISVLILAAV